VNKAGSKIILWLLILAMLGFTMSRTLDFLKRCLPADQQYIAYVALAAFDIGVLGWLYYAMHAASGDKQRALAYGMIFVCSAGVIVTTVCDLFLVSQANGLAVSPDRQLGTIAVWVVSAVIALNFLAGILVHLVDPTHERHSATEKAKDTIFKASLAAIEQRAGEMAPRIAEMSANYWEQKVTQELVGAIPGAKIVESRPLEGQVAMAQTAQLPAPKKKVRKLPQTEKLASQPVDNEQMNKLES
jgi:hypothetical protein